MEDNEKDTKRKVKYCKRCHAEMDRNTKYCPFCGKKQRHPAPWIILIIVAAIIVLSIIFGSVTDSSESKEEASETEEEAANEIVSEEGIDEDNSNEQEKPEIVETEETEATGEEDEYIYVGDTFTVGGLEITFDNYVDDYTDYDNEYGWNTPEDGYKYVAATFTFKNTQTYGTEYISIYDFNCYADDELMEQAYGVVDNGDFINANISPDRTKTFSVAFSVPINSEHIDLEYNTINYKRAEYILKCK